MKIEIFEPQTSDGDKYGVGVKIGGGGFSLIQTYPDLTSLKEGYKQWRNFALRGRIVQPVPVELVDFKDGQGKCKVLVDIVKEIPD